MSPNLPISLNFIGKIFVNIINLFSLAQWWKIFDLSYITTAYYYSSTFLYSSTENFCPFSKFIWNTPRFQNNFGNPISIAGSEFWRNLESEFLSMTNVDILEMIKIKGLFEYVGCICLVMYAGLLIITVCQTILGIKRYQRLSQ